MLPTFLFSRLHFLGRFVNIQIRNFRRRILTSYVSRSVKTYSHTLRCHWCRCSSWQARNQRAGMPVTVTRQHADMNNDFKIENRDLLYWPWLQSGGRRTWEQLCLKEKGNVFAWGVFPFFRNSIRRILEKYTVRVVAVDLWKKSYSVSLFNYICSPKFLLL